MFKFNLYNCSRIFSSVISRKSFFHVSAAVFAPAVYVPLPKSTDPAIQKKWKERNEILAKYPPLHDEDDPDFCAEDFESDDCEVIWSFWTEEETLAIIQKMREEQAKSLAKVDENEDDIQEPKKRSTPNVILSTNFAVGGIDGILMAKIMLHGVEDSIPDHEIQYKNVLETTKSVFEEAYELFNETGFENHENWTKEKHSKSALVHSRHHPRGKIFTLRADFQWNFEKVFREQWTGLDKVAEWNETIEISSTVKKLTDHIDVVHYANKEMYMVKSRDFVVGRIWRKINDDYFLAVRSVEVPESPIDKNRIRAVVNIGAGRYRVHPENPEHTQFDLILSIDLGGLIPKLIINQIMGKVIVDDYKAVKKRIESLKSHEDEKRPPSESE